MILNLAEGQGKTKIAYSGNCTTKTITVNGSQYTLYTITGSGTLTVKGKDQSGVGIWLCGGGDTTSTLYGGGGGYFAQNASYMLGKGTYTITVGAAEGTSTISKSGTAVLTAAGATNQNGGSGGGGEGYVDGPGGQTGGKGSGTSTRPFGDSVNFTSLPCAGGGGGSCSGFGGTSNGGAGGSNGANGGSSTTPSGSSASGGTGGATGGGRGRSTNNTGSGNASYYGSGGGGRYRDAGSSSIKGANGIGYQGVVFMRVPFKATPAPAGAYTYYRLNMTGMMRDSASGTFFSVAELKLYNGSTAISYTGATLTASSSLSGYPVAQAFDGNASTIWHVDGSPTSAWIQAQLSSAAKVTSFSITARSDQNDRLNAFTLEGSNDGSSWTTLYTGSNTASGWAQGGTKTFTI